MKFCDSCQSSYPAEFSTCPKDQSALRSIRDLTTGLVLRGKYEVLGRLGQGGMGAVYKARHTAFGELRAIKVLGTHLADDAAYLARFRAEAVVARRLQHPNAVRVEDFDTTDDGRPFIVMEYVEGTSLREVLWHEGVLPVPRALDLAAQACAALAAAHAIGVVHRDVKPENMLIVNAGQPGEQVKVLDFGLAKVREGFDLGSGGRISTGTGMLLGTPQYIPPEQAMGLKSDAIDGRADLYSLGVVLYEMVTGGLPFQAETPMAMVIQHLQAEPVPPHEARRDLPIPPAFSAVLMQALAKEPAERFADAEEMRQALLRVAAGKPVTVVKPTRGAREVARTVVPARRALAETPVAPTAVRPAPRRTAVAPPAPEPASSAQGSVIVWVGAAAVLLGLGLALARPRRPEPAPEPAATPPPSTATLARPPAGAPGVDDGALYTEVQRLLFQASALHDAQLRVEVANGIVTLSGEATSTTQSELASTLARSVPGVRRVFNTVRVAERTGAAPPPATAAPPPPRAEETTPAAEPTPPPRPPDDDQREVRRLLGDAREELDAGNPDKARGIFEEVLRLDPGNEIATRALERMRQDPPRGGRRP